MTGSLEVVTAAFAAPYLALAVLLVVAGAGKVVHPGPTVTALRSLGLPGGRPAVRLLAAAEVGIGLAAVLGGGALPALAVAASYLAFTAVVLRGLTRGGVLASCGCFGKADTPPTRTHVVVTALAALLAGVVAAAPLPGLPTLLARAPGHGVPLLLATAVLAGLVHAVLAVLPLLHARPAARPVLSATAS